MKKSIYASALLLFVLGCSNSDLSVGTDSMQAEDSNVNVLTSAIVSDPSLDPYTVENMNRAMRKSILAKTSAIDSAEVESMELKPNFLYVRFLVRGKDELAELKARDTTIVYFKHPLDYKPIKKPAVYVDPTLPDSVKPYFATVPADFDFCSTKYDIIKELFLVEPLNEDDDEERDSISAARSVLKKISSGNSVAEKLSDLGVSLQEIEWTSLQMTGNAGNREPSLSQKSTLAKKNTYAWSLLGTGKRYKGHLEFEDEYLPAQMHPLVGVRVTGGYAYYWQETHTDGNGDFKIPQKWNYSIDYEANFDADDFLLENGHSPYGENLEIENNNRKSDWNEKFTGDKAKWCIVWTAAYQYWYGNNFGLKRPRQNTAWNWSLDIEVYYKNKKDYESIFSTGSLIGCNAEGTNGQTATAGVFDNICILAYKRKSYEIYGTTIHEIAHMSHFWNMKTTSTASPQSLEFEGLSKTYRDTYARGIQNYFIMDRYKDAKCKADYDKQYTGLIEDLMDDDGKSKCKEVSGLDIKDDVSGFPITSIETVFFQNKKFSTMKDYLKKKNPSEKNGVKYTSTNIDNLFKCWGL